MFGTWTRLFWAHLYLYTTCVFAWTYLQQNIITSSTVACRKVVLYQQKKSWRQVCCSMIIEEQRFMFSMYVSEFRAVVVWDKCEDAVDPRFWLDTVKRVFCKHIMQTWGRDKVYEQGFLPSLRLVYRLTSRAWEPLSLTKHPGAIFTPLLQDDSAGKGRQRSPTGLTLRHKQSLYSCRAVGPCL